MQERRQSSLTRREFTEEAIKLPTKALLYFFAGKTSGQAINTSVSSLMKSESAIELHAEKLLLAGVVTGSAMLIAKPNNDLQAKIFTGSYAAGILRHFKK